MKKTPVSFGEVEKPCFIQEAFKSLPVEIRNELGKFITHRNDLLEKTEGDVKNLIRLTKTMTAVASLSYMFDKLRATKFEPTLESVYEQEMLTTAFIVTYSRLFADGKGASRISDRRIPKHLKPVHKELINMRNERYAHNGEHDSVRNSSIIKYDGREFSILINSKISMHIGGRNEWEDLIKFVNEYVYDQVFKILERLREKTGYKWNLLPDRELELNDESD